MIDDVARRCPMPTRRAISAAVEPVVARDDEDADSGRVAARDGVGDLGPRRVEQRDQPEQDEVALGVLARRRAAPAPPGSRRRATRDAESLRGVALENREHRSRPVGIRERHVVGTVRRSSSSARAPPPARPSRAR